MDDVEFFSKPFFEFWLRKANEEIKIWLQKEIEYLKKYIKPNSKILDIGCGFGRHIEILAPFSKEVIGIDKDKQMIKKAIQRLSTFNNVRLVVMNAKKLRILQ